MARDLASGSDDRVIVLHVHEFAVGRFGRIQVDCAEGSGERITADIVASLCEAGIAATAEIRKTPVGHIARTILGVADEHDAWLIVLGSTSVHDVPQLPSGSVSLRLLQMATRPVLIVPRSALHASAAEPAAALAAI
jgi:nucleotide-binding universal stress UspA family protein